MQTVLMTIEDMFFGTYVFTPQGTLVGMLLDGEWYNTQKEV